MVQSDNGCNFALQEKIDQIVIVLYSFLIDVVRFKNKIKLVLPPESVTAFNTDEAFFWQCCILHFIPVGMSRGQEIEKQ